MGEYLRAAELISRDIFAQVAFGNIKGMNLIVYY
jgi:hypothetical protein